MAPVLVVLLVAVGAAVAVIRTSPSRPPVSPTQAAAAPASRSRVLEYLRQISGTATVAGQHNREPLARPTRWTDEVRRLTETSPGLYGGDFAFSGVADRPRLVAAAIAQWRAGSLVTLMWHMCPPGLGQTCDWKHDVQSRLTDAQWTELTTAGTPLNRAWTAQVDAVVPYLRQLQAAGVEVLWRPLHELNDRWAWWGGRPGPAGSSALFRMFHDHLTALGLTNLVWVWSVSDADVDRAADYDPGERYADVVGLDAWAGAFPNPHSYDLVRRIAGRRPIALTEVGTVPTPTQLAAQPRWVYFMVWAEMLLQRSSVARIQYTYGDRRVLTQGRIALPGGDR